MNNIDVTRMECNQVVPLLCSSADELTLVVGRRPAPMFDETDELFDDVDEDEHQSAIVNDNSIWNSSMNTTINENNNNTTTTNNTFSLLSQSKTSTV